MSSEAMCVETEDDPFDGPMACDGLWEDIPVMCRMEGIGDEDVQCRVDGDEVHSV